MDNKKIEVKNVYVVRAKPHYEDREDEFLSGMLSIGWPGIGDVEGCDREEIRKRLIDSQDDPKALKITQIHNFINLPVGTIVLTPSIKNRDIHIFITTSGYKYNKAHKEVNPHKIACRHVKTIDRESISGDLIRSINAGRKTVTNLSKFASEVSELINERATKVEKEVNNFDKEIIKTLRDLLKSEDENVRLQAAINLHKVTKGEK
jgi:predicted Mrr-cat superfamily restriction endonuclease